MAVSWNYKLRQWVAAPYPYRPDQQHMVDMEIDELKRKYIQDQITLEELEEQIENWLKWEQMNPVERLEFEHTR